MINITFKYIRVSRMLHLERFQLEELQEFLENINKKVGFLGTFICSDEGLIVMSTHWNNQISPGALDVDAVAALIASFLFKNEIMDISYMSDLTITFNRIVIHVHLIRSIKTGNNRLRVLDHCKNKVKKPLFQYVV